MKTRANFPSFLRCLQVFLGNHQFFPLSEENKFSQSKAQFDDHMLTTGYNVMCLDNGFILLFF